MAGKASWIRAGRWVIGAALLFLLAVAPARALAAPGDLDASFGSGGIVTSDLEEAGATDVTMQSDGKIVTAGSTSGCTGSGEDFTCHSDFLIERYNMDGTPDTSFGDGDGIVTTGFGDASQSATSIAIDPSGKLLVSGTTYNASLEAGEFAVVRYNTDGTLDTSFGGGDGKAMAAVSDLEGLRNWSGSMALLPSGKIVLGGEVFVHESDFAFWHFALARFNADGSLDTSFGTGGTAVGPRGELFGLGEEPGGKLLAVGRAGESDFAVARFNADGSLDTSFGGGDGIASLNLSPVGSQANDVLLQPDGKIVASGFASFFGFAVARFNTNGTPDTTFGGGDGVTLTEFSQPCCGLGSAISIAFQPDGRIVFAGQWNPDEDSLNDEWAVGRFYANGSPDKSFGTAGMVTTDVAGGGHRNYASGVALQSDGKIVAAGSTGAPDHDLAVARYEGGGSPSPTFHNLLVSKHGAGDGQVSAPELRCGVNCGADYVAGETVTLNAFAEFGSSFAGWNTMSGSPGTCTGLTSPCEVTLSADVELEATFDSASLPQYTLTLNKAGSGAGSVFSLPSGIDCGSSCSHTFDMGAPLKLVATPFSGSTFTGWSGGDCSGTGGCELTLSADTQVTATFAMEPSGGGGSESGGGGGSQPPGSVATPVLPRKPLHCRKHFKKQKVHGKQKCVRVRRGHKK